MAKAKNKIKIAFPSPFSETVCGSMTLIEMSNAKILLEAGLHQNPNLKEQYAANARSLGFKPSTIDFIFIGHAHADHSLLLPRLVKMGFSGRVIAPKGFSKLFKVMALDSCHIIRRECITLTSQTKREYEPIYDEQDVHETLKLIDEYDFHEKVSLNDNITFEFFHAGHIILSAQIKLWLREGNQIKTIGFTSDIGNPKIEKYYAGQFELMDKVQLLIGEATYARQIRDVNKKDRQNDLNKMREIIRNTCCDARKKVLIPSFSLDRSQNIITHLYNLFANDTNFHIPIIIDSPLTVQLCEVYKELLDGDELAKYLEVLSWKNLKLVTDYEQSVALQASKEPCVVIASAGMMNAGRSVKWAQTLLPDAGNHILMVGFAVENSLADIIRNGKQKKILIEKKNVSNRCGLTELHSFSSHADRGSLMDYYSNITAEKICLVHSEMQPKIDFAVELHEQILHKNRTTKVVAVNRSTTISL